MIPQVVTPFQQSVLSQKAIFSWFFNSTVIISYSPDKQFCIKLQMGLKDTKCAKMGGFEEKQMGPLTNCFLQFSRPFNPRYRVRKNYDPKIDKFPVTELSVFMAPIHPNIKITATHYD
jgi:hypothetical protein